MAATSDPRHVRYRKTSPPGAGRYEVVYQDRVIGVVGRFRLSAGQFGSRWVATTPPRRKSGQYTSRDAAAGWLLERKNPTDYAPVPPNLFTPEQVLQLFAAALDSIHNDLPAPQRDQATQKLTTLLLEFDNTTPPNQQQ